MAAIIIHPRIAITRSMYLSSSNRIQSLHSTSNNATVSLERRVKLSTHLSCVSHGRVKHPYAINIPLISLPLRTFFCNCYPGESVIQKKKKYVSLINPRIRCCALSRSHHCYKSTYLICIGGTKGTQCIRWIPHRSTIRCSTISYFVRVDFTVQRCEIVNSPWWRLPISPKWQYLTRTSPINYIEYRPSLIWFRWKHDDNRVCMKGVCRLGGGFCYELLGKQWLEMVSRQSYTMLPCIAHLGRSKIIGKRSRIRPKKWKHFLWRESRYQICTSKIFIPVHTVPVFWSAWQAYRDPLRPMIEYLETDINLRYLIHFLVSSKVEEMQGDQICFEQSTFLFLDHTLLVSLITIHSCQGCRYSNVYLICAKKKIYPSISSL